MWRVERGRMLGVVSRRHTLFVFVGVRRVECGVMAGASWMADTVFDVGVDSEEASASPLSTLCAALRQLEARPGPAVDEIRVVVADSWLAVAGVPWSSSLKGVAGLERHARLQLDAAGFEIDPFDTVKVDDAPFGEPRLAAAYPAPLLNALDQLAASRRARLVSVLPLSVAAWEAGKRQEGGRLPVVAVLDAGLSMIVRATGSDGARPGELTVRLHEPTDHQPEEVLHRVWGRLCLREPHLAAAGGAALVDLTQSGEETSVSKEFFAAIRFPVREMPVSVAPGLHLAASARRLRHPLDSRLGRVSGGLRRAAVLGVLALVTGALVLDAVQTSAAVRARAAELDGPASKRPVSRPQAPWSREELARVLAVNAAIRELNMPIDDILRALEPPRDLRVAILSVETAAAQTGTDASAIKILAEVPTGSEMARYVGFVATRRPFTEAYLVRHEIEQSSADRPFRFTVDARWRE